MSTEITEHDPNASPGHDDGGGNGNGALAAGDSNRGIKRARPNKDLDDDDDDDDKPGRERRKIEIKFIQDKSRRHITFSKRKAGIMKKVSVLPSRASFAQSVALHHIATHHIRIAGIMLTIVALGLRAFRSHRHPSSTSRRLRDRPRLHLHDAEATTSRHKE